MILEFEDGKYTYVNDDSGQRVLRYGEPWREITGDKFIYLMASRIEQLERQLAERDAELQRYRDAPVVAWADDKAVNGQIGNCASDSAKRYWEKSNWSDRASAEKLKHALIVKPGEQ